MALIIKATIWHGTPGYTVRGKVNGRTMFPVAIFTRYRDLAERIRAALKRNDFNGDVETAIWDEERRRNEAARRPSPSA